MFVFSEYTQKVLKGAGWNENYTTDTSGIEQVLTDAGFDYSPTIDRFLHRFMGVYIQYPHIQDVHILSRLYIDPIRALRETVSEELERYKTVINAKFCLVGLFSDTILLIMTLDGQLYGVVDQIIILYGNSGEEGIDNMINNKYVKNWEIDEFT